MNSTILPVSILIPTLNRPKALRDTICSFISLAKKPHEIIIVDQSDSDETEFVINEFSTRETDIVFKYVQLSVKSSTMARNIAMSNATNNICIFCDDDIEVPPNVIEKVYVRMLTPSTTMIAGIDYRTFGMQDTNTRISRMFNSVFLFTDNKKTNSGYVTGSMLGCFPRSITGVVSTEWAMGFFFAIKLSKAREWEIEWDEKLSGYAYGEDLDFSHRYYMRSREAGLECLMYKDIGVYHNCSEENRIKPLLHIIKYVVNREYLCYKWQRKRKFHLACRWSNFGFFLIKLYKCQKPLQVLYAQALCDINRRKIKNGDLDWVR